VLCLCVYVDDVWSVDKLEMKRDFQQSLLSKIGLCEKGMRERAN
jgi:hypothetical protein